MSHSSHKYPTDDRFGPSVQGCRSNFDFTLFFEQTILTVVPLLCLMLLGLGRVGMLARQKELVFGRMLKALKQVSLSCHSYEVVEAH